MRRGLMEWNPQELPVDVLDARIARLRAEMKRAGLDAFIIYTNLVRPSAVAHLTGFTPYWSEGLAAGADDGPAGVCDSAVEPRGRLDPIDQSGQ